MATPAPLLLRLPPELMLRISLFLNTADLGKFRLSCKAVETNLFDSFAREFFTKRQFMVEEVSLTALVDISRHKTLSPYLSEIIISLDTLIAPRQRSEQQVTNTSRDILLATGRARDLLVEAFTNLCNLRIVGLRDYDGKDRLRDGALTTWKSYGWSTGAVDRRPYHTRPLPVSILPLILCALGESSRKPESIEIFLRRARLSDSSFELGPNFLRPRVAPVLSGLKTLLLSLQDDSHHSIDHEYENLKEFLHHTPLLEHLRLNFMSHQRATDAPGKLLAWLGTSPSHTKHVLPTPIKLENLASLELGMLTAKPEVLLRLVSKFAKLKTLSLWKIALKGMASNVTDPDVSDLWSYFLPKLGEAFQEPQDITEVMIGWAVEVVHDAQTGVMQPVKFAGEPGEASSDEGDQGKRFEDAEHIVKFRRQFGGSAKEWLTALGNRTCLPPEPEEPNDSDLSISDDEDDGGIGVSGESDVD